MNIFKLGLLSVTFILFSCGESKNTEKVATSEGEVELNSELEPESEAPDKVYFEAEVEALIASKSGDRITLVLSEEESHELVIGMIGSQVPGVTGISGYIKDRTTGMANLVIKDNKLRGSLDFIQNSRTIQISYDEERGKHYYQVLRPEDKDVMQGSEPLTPPSDYQN